MSETEDEVFLRRLKGSTKAVSAVAEWMRKDGFSVTVPELMVRPKFDDRAAFSDSGDLIVSGKRMEVKGRQVNFTTFQTWPYPDMLICAKKSFDLLDPKPYCYIIVNKELTHCAIANVAETYPFWVTGVQHDRLRGIDYPVYTIDPMRAKFWSFAYSPKEQAKFWSEYDGGRA